MVTLTAKEQRQTWWFSVLNYIVLGFFLFSIIYPIYYLTMMSFSTFGGLNSGNKNPFMLYPAGFTLEAYKNFIKHPFIRAGFLVTIFRTVVGTLASIVVTALAAYALSRKELPGKKFFTVMFTLTMFFSAGIIPGYLNMRDFGLLDNIWVLVIGPLINTYYLLILRSYFTTLPESILESARIDGAGESEIFLKIIIPLSMPAIITVITWTFFNHWNAWFDSMLYTTNQHIQVLQLQIRRMVVEQNVTMLGGMLVAGGKADMPTEATVRATGIIATILPVLLIYPFTKRFFTKGMTLGAVKG